MEKVKVCVYKSFDVMKKLEVWKKNFVTKHGHADEFTATLTSKKDHCFSSLPVALDRNAQEKSNQLGCVRYRRLGNGTVH